MPTTAPASSGTAGSTPASSPSPAASQGQNLPATLAVLSELTAAYAAFQQIPVSDIAGETPLHGSAYYAYDPATGKYWALASFSPGRKAPLNVQVAFQDGGQFGFYTATQAGTWQAHTGGNPAICAEVRFFPLAVMKAWALPTTSSMCG